MDPAVVVEKTVVAYVVLRSFTLPSREPPPAKGVLVCSGERLAPETLTTEEAESLRESRSLAIEYADGAVAGPPPEPVHEVVVERLLMRPDSVVLNHLLAEPTNPDRLKAAAAIADTQHRPVLSAALRLALQYDRRGRPARGPSARRGARE